MLKKFAWGAVLVIVAVIAGAIGKDVGRSVVGRSATLEAPRATTTTSHVESELLSSSEMYRVLKAEFPEDFGVLVTNLQRIVNSTTSMNQLGLAAFNESAKIRKKYSNFIAKGPDDDLVKLLISYKYLHQFILDKEGYETCNILASKGAAALIGKTKILKDISEIATQQSIIYFRAVAKAQRNPIDHGIATDSDWETIISKMVDSGVPEEYIQILTDQKLTSPDLCRAAIALLDAIIAMPGDVGSRIRSTFTAQIAGS